MVEKDWSLKDKEIKTIHYENADGTKITVSYPDYCTVFRKSEIDILRQKLIEDIKDGKEFRDEWNNQFNTADGMRDTIINIINKRFGAGE